MGYYRIGTGLWDDRLTYFEQTTGGLVTIRPGTDTPAQRGFTDQQASVLFGIPPIPPGPPGPITTKASERSFASNFAAEHLPMSGRMRLDSRHEVDAPMQAGIFNVVPYVAGRFTGYNENFEEYNGNGERSPPLLGQRRPAAQHGFQPDVRPVQQSDLFDVHRIRHIIEPNANIFLTGSTLQSEGLPVYDPDVEGINDGPGRWWGFKNTLQTQRGGEGRWRSVDWLVVNSDLIFMHRDTSLLNTDPIARFIDLRPEDSIGGSHFYGDAMWMLSDTLAAVGQVTESLDDGSVEQWRVGMAMQHSPCLHLVRELHRAARRRPAGVPDRLQHQLHAGVLPRGAAHQADRHGVHVPALHEVHGGRVQLRAVG